MTANRNSKSQAPSTKQIPSTKSKCSKPRLRGLEHSALEHWHLFVILNLVLCVPCCFSAASVCVHRLSHVSSRGIQRHRRRGNDALRGVLSHDGAGRA